MAVSASNVFVFLSNKFLLQGKGSLDDTVQITWDEFFQDQLTIIFLGAILALLAAFIIVCILSAHMLKSYRKDMTKLYKHEVICKRMYTNTPVQLVLRANKYAGYQVAYFFWGFILQSLFLWLIFVILGEILVFPLIYGMWNYLKGFLYRFGPLIIMMYATWAVQYLLVKYFFVQGRGKDMALDNRRGFMNLMYFFFFYNMFVGLFSCFQRILKSTIFGLLFIPRLDRSIMPKSFQKYDKGFEAYLCLLKLESLQTNPIIITFLSELYSIAQAKAKIDPTTVFMQEVIDYEAQAKTKRIARTRWFLAKTLILNPSLQVERWTRDRVRTNMELLVVPRMAPLRLEDEHV